MELWKWIIVILVVLLLLYLGYLYFGRVEEGFETTPTIPKTVADLPILIGKLPQNGNAIDASEKQVDTVQCTNIPTTVDTNKRTYMYIFDPTAAWVQANIALLEYPVVKKEVYKSLGYACQSASGVKIAEGDDEGLAKRLDQERITGEDMTAKQNAAAAAISATDAGSSTVAAAAEASFRR